MNPRVLTPAEDAYVQSLAYRILDLQGRIETLMKQPLTDTHEETGMLVCHAVSKLIWAMAWLEHDLLEALQ